MSQNTQLNSNLRKNNFSIDRACGMIWTGEIENINEIYQSNSDLEIIKDRSSGLFLFRLLTKYNIFD